MPVPFIADSVFAPGATVNVNAVSRIEVDPDRACQELSSSGQSLRDIQLFALPGGSTTIIITPALLDPTSLRLLHDRLVATTFEAVSLPSPAFANLVRLILHTPPNLYTPAALCCLFKHTPRLRELDLRMPRDDGEYRRPLFLIKPTFQLETFIYHGDIARLMCARIVECSSRTLRTLHLLDVYHGRASEEADAELCDALLMAAPRLRELRISIPGRPGIDAFTRPTDRNVASDISMINIATFVRRLEPVFAALARVAVLEIHTPMLYLIYWATRLLACLPPGASVQHLLVTRCHRRLYDEIDRPFDFLLNTTHLRMLRTVTIGGFYIPTDVKGRVLEHFRKRRVRFVMRLVIFETYDSLPWS